MDIFEIYGGEKSLKLSEIGGHNSKRPKRIVKEIGKFFSQYLSNDAYEFNFNNNVLKNNGDEDGIDEEILDMGKYFRNKEFKNNKIIHNKNNISIDIDKSYDFKIGEVSKEEYIIQKEEDEKKNLDVFKNCLKNMNPNEIEKDNIDLNSTSDNI